MVEDARTMLRGKIAFYMLAVEKLERLVKRRANALHRQAPDSRAQSEAQQLYRAGVFQLERTKANLDRFWIEYDHNLEGRSDG